MRLKPNHFRVDHHIAIRKNEPAPAEERARKKKHSRERDFGDILQDLAKSPMHREPISPSR